jgi:hypothetical protein
MTGSLPDCCIFTYNKKFSHASPAKEIDFSSFMNLFIHSSLSHSANKHLLCACITLDTEALTLKKMPGFLLSWKLGEAQTHF